MQSQIHCALVFAKANNQMMADVNERTSKMECRMGGEVNLINPLQNSEIPPALEVEE
jgi:hypothetical protein